VNFRGEPLGCRLRVVMGHADEDDQAGPVDAADGRTVDADARPADPLHHRPHAAHGTGSPQGRGTMPTMSVTPASAPSTATTARTLITVAPTGAETAKAAAPPLPVTLDELVEAAQACEKARAAMVHVHIRDANAQPTLDLRQLRDTVQALREGTGLVVQLSTGGAVTDSYEERLRVLDAAPDSCSLTMGTVNFGDDVFLNPWPFVVELYELTKEREIVPEFELFDLGHVAALRRLLDGHGLPFGGQVHCDLVMGVPGGMPGTVETLVAAVQALPPQVTSWSATGVGRASLPVALAALAAGGHLRVGMEDTLTFAKGQPVRDNAQLVERAAQLATLAQRPPMSADDARSLLNIRTAA
jgi:3-keto-5-aminohexanoate cleavage enzyme